MRWALVVCGLIVGCGVPPEPPPEPPPNPPVVVPRVQITVSPTSIVLSTGGSHHFNAVVTGTSDTAVRWSAEAGTITSDGLFTAPATEGHTRVTATSVADPAATAVAEVTIAAPQTGSLQLEPREATIGAGGTVQFSVVTQPPNSEVTWSVTETGGGTVTGSGVYTAPDAAGTYHVVARSRVDPTLSAKAAVTVVAAEPIAVAIMPRSISLGTAQKHQFHATVTGTSDSAVTWSADAGAVDPSGLYTAPSTAGTYHVLAHSHADPSRLAEATVEVTTSPTVEVTIAPESVTLRPGDRYQFTASVTGSANASVDWSADAGTIDASGAYTAPARAGTFHVTATSHADPTRSASATVTVQETAGVAVTIDAPSTEVAVGGFKVFHAKVTGAQDTRVTWSVVESTGGEIDQSGFYTAPTDARGVFHVVVTSVADPSKSARASVTVQHEDLIDRGASVVAASRVFALWWGPAADFPADARPAMESLFTAIDGSQYLAVADQYLRGARASVTFAGSLFDTTVPPENASEGPAVFDAACRALAAAGVSPRKGDMVFVYTSNFPTNREGFCAWHGFATCEGVDIPVSYMPNPEGTICTARQDFGCGAYSAATRALSSDTAHELLSSMTNPFGSGWSDWGFAEIADKCMPVYGCVDLRGGVRLQLQGMYSNAIHACTLSGK